MIPDFLTGPDWRPLLALAIGLLIGAERERRKGEGETRASAGLRTFGFVGFLGGLAAETGSTTLVLLAGAFTASAALVGYALGDRRDPGLTSEVALVVTFVLGVLVQTRPMLALASSIIVTVLLAARDPLHRLVRDVITRQELLDGLTFAIAALVVLPLLPDRTIDPFGLVNPFALWRLAVVLMGLSALGYTAQRLLGPRYGLTVAGFASGFVSSSAAIAAMGGRARADARRAGRSAAGAVASILGSLVYLLALVVAADPGLFRRLVLPLGLAVALTLVYAASLTFRAARAGSEPMTPGRAFDARTAVLFAVLVAVFALVSTGLTSWLGSAGALAGAAVTGLADAHATAVSLATLATAGTIGEDAAALAILIGLSANMAVKAPMAFTLGPPAYAMRVTLGLALLLIGIWAGYAWEMLAGVL